MAEGECHKALRAPIQMLSSAFSADQTQGGFCLPTDSASPLESLPLMQACRMRSRQTRNLNCSSSSWSKCTSQCLRCFTSEQTQEVGMTIPTLQIRKPEAQRTHMVYSVTLLGSTSTRFESSVLPFIAECIF